MITSPNRRELSLGRHGKEVVTGGCDYSKQELGHLVLHLSRL
jgi:hypothetical protein